jgi:hypothetical protein
MTVSSHPPYFSLFLRLKIKLICRHFNTVEVIEGESQAVLNTLTKHTTSRIHFKNGRSAGNGAHERKDTTSRLWPVGLELGFDLIAAPFLEIMDAALYM